VIRYFNLTTDQKVLGLNPNAVTDNQALMSIGAFLFDAVSTQGGLVVPQVIRHRTSAFYFILSFKLIFIEMRGQPIFQVKNLVSSLKQGIEQNQGLQPIFSKNLSDFLLIIMT